MNYYNDYEKALQYSRSGYDGKKILTNEDLEDHIVAKSSLPPDSNTRPLSKKILKDLNIPLSTKVNLGVPDLTLDTANPRPENNLGIAHKHTAEEAAKPYDFKDHTIVGMERSALKNALLETKAADTETLNDPDLFENILSNVRHFVKTESNKSAESSPWDHPETLTNPNVAKYILAVNNLKLIGSKVTVKDLSTHLNKVIKDALASGNYPEWSKDVYDREVLSRRDKWNSEVLRQDDVSRKPQEPALDLRDLSLHDFELPEIAIPKAIDKPLAVDARGKGLTGERQKHEGLVANLLKQGMSKEDIVKELAKVFLLSPRKALGAYTRGKNKAKLRAAIRNIKLKYQKRNLLVS